MMTAKVATKDVEVRIADTKTGHATTLYKEQPKSTTRLVRFTDTELYTGDLLDKFKKNIAAAANLEFCAEDASQSKCKIIPLPQAVKDNILKFVREKQQKRPLF